MADDLSTIYTDKKLQALERKLTQTYKQAQKDIEKKTKTFFEKTAKKDAVMQGKLSAGKITQDEYDHWRQGKMLYGENWRAQQESIAKVLADTNRVATAMINAEKADVFAFAGNYTAYEFEHGFGMNFGFDLYSEKSVGRLLRDNPKILPKKKLDPAKDIPWNMRNLRAQVTQGIIQGESIPKIAKRLSEVVPNRNEKQMVLHARTAMTGAQNGGRMERYKEAEDLGIKFKKVWTATLDNRTRDEHRDLDGQAVKPDEPFKIHGEKIMFPGDPDADPSLVYNCRCTLTTELDDYPSSFTRRAQEDGSIIKDQSYREWEASKKTGGATTEIITPVDEKMPELPKPEPLRELARIKASMSENDYKEFYDKVNGNEFVQSLYEDYEGSFPVYRDGGGYFNRATGVHYGIGDGKDSDKFSTLSHEMGHGFDWHGKNDFNVSFGEVDLLNDKCTKGTGYKYEPFKKTPSLSDEYLSAMRKDKAIIRSAIMDDDVRKSLIADDYSQGVQDLADGLFATRDSKSHWLPWGHGNKYYNRAYNQRIKGMGLEKEVKEAMAELGFDASNQAKVKTLMRQYEAASELWANQCAALTVGGKELEYMEKYCPNSLQAIKDILKGRTVKP